MSEAANIEGLPQACEDCPVGDLQTCVFHIRTAKAGELLLPADEVPRRLVHVRKGVASLVLSTTAGRESAFILREPGSLLGLEMLAEKRSPFEVTMHVDGEICTLPRAAARQWLAEAPEEVVAILRKSASEVARLAQERRELAQPAGLRLAAFLLRMNGDHPPPTRGQIARSLAMRPETLSRLLARFREDGLIGEGLDVADRGRLELMLSGSGTKDR